MSSTITKAEETAQKISSAYLALEEARKDLRDAEESEYEARRRATERRNFVNQKQKEFDALIAGVSGAKQA